MSNKRKLVFFLLFVSIAIAVGIVAMQPKKGGAKGHYARLPIHCVNGQPLLEFEIEKKPYLLELDLGASCEFNLFKESLEAIHEKKYVDTQTAIDIKGNRYQERCFLLPEIRAKNFEYKNPTVGEESLDFVTKGALLWSQKASRSPIPFVGRAGWRFCGNNNLFIDFPNEMLFITQSLDELRKDHWPISPRETIPFEMSSWGILVTVEIDTGPKKFILDTGANVSILKANADDSQWVTTQKMLLGTRDLGKRDLFLYPIESPPEIEGILGMDVLRNLAIFLDFDQKKALVGPSTTVCGAIVRENKKVTEIPLTFPEGIPTCDVEIQGGNHSLILSLGFDSEIILPSDVLNSLTRKEHLGTDRKIFLDGTEEFCDQYLLQQMRFKKGGKMIHPRVEESVDSCSGKMGRKILQMHPLFFDFSRSFFAIVDSFEDLSSLGYTLSDFTPIPFEKTRWGVTFTVEGDFKPKRFFLNTEALSSAVRGPSQVGEVKIGGFDLGSIAFSSAEISPDINDIDGYLGIDFFKRHCLFIDLSKNIVLIGPSNY
jgi:hypothetical protein